MVYCRYSDYWRKSIGESAAHILGYVDIALVLHWQMKTKLLYSGDDDDDTMENHDPQK